MVFVMRGTRIKKGFADMKKGEEYIGVIETVTFPNKGRVKLGESSVLVKGGLPGQRVKFRLNKKRKSGWEGRLLSVEEPSPLETRLPVCEEFGFCGGCTYQRVSYEEQLKLKAGQVKVLLDGAAWEPYVFEDILKSPKEWGYRNKMEFSFGDDRKDGPLTLGLHKKNSMYDVISTRDCKIADEDFTQVLSCTLDYFTELKIGFYKKISHEGYLRHLLIRRAVKTGEMLISLVTSSQAEPDLSDYRKKLLKLPLRGEIKGILHIVNDSLADVVQSDKTEILYGQDFFYEELLGLTFKISTFSFFQTNSLGAEVLYTKAREYIGDTKDKLVFDLYSGTGTIAQMMAPVAKKVIGVEIVEEAVVAARENALRNGLENCEFIAGDVLKVLDEIREKPDFIVLDPPRDGLHPKALKKIVNYGVERLVYISCKPTSLARDLEGLQEAGYRMEKACCVDMFPQTQGIETVVLLSKKAMFKENDNENI
jgi:23S rRNA (uracil-5-)-methyltransferase RumA